MTKQESKVPILEVKDLRVNFHTYRGEVKALNGVNLKLYEHEVLGIVGESGCGKSVTALSIIGLLPQNASVVGGQILFKGEDLLKQSEEKIRLVRAHEIATVFQDPMTYLNPVLTIQTQLEETFMFNKNALAHLAIRRKKGKIGYRDFLLYRKSNENCIEKSEASESKSKNFFRKIIFPFSNKEHNNSLVQMPKVSKSDIKEVARTLCVEVLRLVKLPDPERILRQYPFELSGGMRQRVMIAMALARCPSIFIADEITTALDVTIQAQILHLLRELRDEIDASVLLITHDLSVAAELAGRVAVMYGGNVVEVAPTRKIFEEPLHPYTRLLMKAVPDINRPAERLESIPGTVPEMINPPSGCRFNPRCPSAMDICHKKRPELKEMTKNHEVACYLYQGGE